MKVLPANLPFRKILVPVDFSECSRAGLQFAAALAAQLGSDLVLVHVVDPYLGTGDLLLDMARMQTNSEVNARKQLEDWAMQINPPAATIVRIGSPAHEIIETAAEIGADAIVIPSHGRGAIGRFLMGGVAERVVRHAACPVIVLPWNKRNAGQKKLNISRENRAKQRPTAAQPRRQYEPIA